MEKTWYFLQKARIHWLYEDAPGDATSLFRIRVCTEISIDYAEIISTAVSKWQDTAPISPYTD
jgi:hypothetical protein